MAADEHTFWNVALSYWPFTREWILKPLVGAVLVGSISHVIRHNERERRKFEGKWQIKIYWDAGFASLLFGQNTHDPYSIGEAALSYGFGPKRRLYWGQAFFRLHDGNDLYAKLAISLENVEVREEKLLGLYLRKASLKSITLRAEIRKPEREFKYAPFANYWIEFDESRSDEFGGRMMHSTKGKVGFVEGQKL